MKIDKTPSTSKLTLRFDNELKKLLIKDLKAFKAGNKFINSNNQVIARCAA